VAQRANISPTWYTWLEQGRGGAPSADVLERISRALMLTDVEREHLFLLGWGGLRRRDTARRRGDAAAAASAGCAGAEPGADPDGDLGRAGVNRAATVMLTDYGALPPDQRNVLRFMFLDPRAGGAV